MSPYYSCYEENGYVIHATEKTGILLFMLRGKWVYYYSCYGESGYFIHASGKMGILLFMVRGKWVYYYSCYRENGYIIIHATGKTGSFEISFQVMKGLELLMGSKDLKKVAKSKKDSFCFEAEIKEFEAQT